MAAPTDDLLATAEVRGAPASALSEAELQAYAALMRRVFFPPGTRFTRGPEVVDGRALAVPEERIEVPDGRVYVRPALLETTPALNLWHFALWDGARPCAHAMTFERTVTTARGPLPLLALAGVCVERSMQGRGLGRRVVEHAFAHALTDSVRCALFQTGVPDFYRGLRCRTVDNRFVNRSTALDPEADAFWDRYAMIYPADFDWPSGVIDLCGSGF